jgi:hypothetical protein
MHPPRRLAISSGMTRKCPINLPGFFCWLSFYLLCAGAAGEGTGAGEGAVGAGAVRVWPTVVLGAVLAEWSVSRGQKNSAPIIRTAAAIAAMVPVLNPSRVTGVVRVSRSSLIGSSPIMAAPFQTITFWNCSNEKRRARLPAARREPMVHPHPAIEPITKTTGSFPHRAHARRRDHRPRVSMTSPRQPSLA